MIRTIHTYGDSHAAKHGGWDRIKIDGINISINHLGAKLMYSFGRDKNIVTNGNVIKANDILCFCFGEIDCRCHVHKYAPNWRENINDLVSSYFQNIKRNVENYPSVTICVYNVVPPLERELERNLWMEKKVSLPTQGNDQERKIYTLYMNDLLREYCKSYGYLFFDVYNKYIDEKGFLKYELSDKNCHIGDPVYMKEFIVKNLL